MATDTRKWRLWSALRWWKITAIALSSTLKASELKNTIVTSSTGPSTSRWSRKLDSSATMAFDCPGSSHSR